MNILKKNFPTYYKKMKYHLVFLLLSVLLFFVTACNNTGRLNKPPNGTISANQVKGIHKIKHIIIIMQENRSFDSYFGTFPGADGIPMKNGVPTVACPDPLTGEMVRPIS